MGDRRSASRAAWSVVGLLIAAALAWWSGRDESGDGVTLMPEASRATAGNSSAPQTGPADRGAVGPSPGAAAVDLPDPVGGALDLKRLFDQAIGSGEPRQHRIAARAFDACVPAFLPAGGETPSPEPLIRSLPLERRVEREAAYRSLYARCQGFIGLGRASLEGLQRQLQADPDADEPGRRAQEDLLAGRAERVDALVARSLVAEDPAAVAALAGLAVRLAQGRTQDAPEAGLVRRARAVDAALLGVACDLGLDCSATSLTALQLCAVQGLCEGGVASRMASAPESDVAQSEVEQQRSRLLALIRSGRPLTTVDLLP